VKNYTVRKYEPEDYSKWNAFIGNAKNATFLFHRDFMEYHNDRFQDYSLVVLDGENWVAVLPANVVGEAVFSHQGLTYGGVIVDKKMKQSVMLNLFRAILKFLNSNKIKKLHLKIMPAIYFDYPSDELNYALFLVDSKLLRRDSLSVIDNSKTSLLSRARKACVRRGYDNGLVIKEEPNFKIFWDAILIPNIAQKHDAKPVHSVQEIEKLHQMFPGNIRHFNVYDGDKIVAGTTIFVSKNVAHPQYVSGQSDKNELGSLDFLYHHLITDVFKDKRYFDFGISNEENGRKLNEGLIFWKESFGARTLTQDFYEIQTANYVKLENVLI
jgi:hypothetical protein